MFHLLPLSVLLLALSALPRIISPGPAMLMAIVIVSLLEPVFQTMPMAASDHYPPSGPWYVWGCTCRCSTGSSYSAFDDLILSRCMPAAWDITWHMVWGEIRLQLLF